MFYRFYPHFKNLLIRSNYISHLFTSTNQEIVFDQSQFISVLFLVYSFNISLLCLCILRNPAVFDSITCQFLYRNYHNITKKNRAISCHSLFPAWECKQTWLLLNFVPSIDFTSSQFPAFEKRQNCQFWLFGRNLPKKDFSSLKQKKWTAPLNSAYSNYSWYQISAETNKFDFFGPNLPIKGVSDLKQKKWVPIATNSRMSKTQKCSSPM